MVKSKLVGKIAQVKDPESWYNGDYGYIIYYDGEYHLGGGSIGDMISPVFDRDQLRIPKNQESFRVNHNMRTWSEMGINGD